MTDNPKYATIPTVVNHIRLSYLLEQLVTSESFLSNANSMEAERIRGRDL